MVVPPGEYLCSQTISDPGALLSTQSSDSTAILVPRASQHEQLTKAWQLKGYQTAQGFDYTTLWGKVQHKLPGGNDLTSWPTGAATLAGLVRIRLSGSSLNLNSTDLAKIINDVPTVIFLESSSLLPLTVNFNDGLALGSLKKVIFVVNGNVTLDKQITEFKGSILSAGFIDTADPNPGRGEHRPLTLHGVLISEEQLIFSRRVTTPATDPAEVITLLPSLYLEFVDLIGEVQYEWRLIP